MLFDKIKVAVHVEKDRCLVHLIYGDTADQSMHAALLNSLLKAGVQVVPTHESLPSLPAIDRALAASGSICYRLHEASYNSGHGARDDGQTISFYTSTRDLAKGALAQLAKDGFKLNKSSLLLQQEIDRAAEKLEKRGK